MEIRRLEAAASFELDSSSEIFKRNTFPDKKKKKKKNSKQDDRKYRQILRVRVLFQRQSQHSSAVQASPSDGKSQTQGFNGGL